MPTLIFWLFLSFMLFLRKRREALKKVSMYDLIRNFVRWTSRVERSCSQSKLKLPVPFFILRPKKKPLRIPL